MHGARALDSHSRKDAEALGRCEELPRLLVVELMRLTNVQRDVGLERIPTKGSAACERAPI